MIFYKRNSDVKNENERKYSINYIDATDVRY